MISTVLSAALGSFLTLLAVFAVIGLVRIRRWRRLAATARRLCAEGSAEEAVRLSGTLLAAAEEVLHDTNPLLTDILRTHALANQAAGRPAEAEDAAKRALRNLQGQDADPLEEGPLLQLLALSLRAQGRLTEAVGTAESALEAAERLLPPSDLRLAEYAVTLARTYQSSGKTARAAQLYQRALELLEEPDGDPERADLVRAQLLELEGRGPLEEPSGEFGGVSIN